MAIVWSVVLWIGAVVMVIVGALGIWKPGSVGNLQGGGAWAVFIIGLILLIAGLAIPGPFY